MKHLNGTTQETVGSFRLLRTLLKSVGATSVGSAELRIRGGEVCVPETRNIPIYDPTHCNAPQDAEPVASPPSAFLPGWRRDDHNPSLGREIRPVGRRRGRASPQIF